MGVSINSVKNSSRCVNPAVGLNCYVLAPPSSQVLSASAGGPVVVVAEGKAEGVQNPIA